MSNAGRPKGSNNKDNLCSMRLDEKTLRRLTAYCEKMNMAKSAAIREAIEKMLEKEGL